MRRRLDARGLEMFVAVADALSFRHGALSLHISQPPLSRGIRELEERLGARLFERDTRAVTLSDAGRRLLPRARHILQLLSQAEAELLAIAEPSLLRLGLSNAVQPSWFQGLADRIRAAHPALIVQTTSTSSPRLVRQLRSRTLDAAFIALPTEAEGLRVTEVARYPMCAALPATHALARRRVLRLADLAAEPVFWFERARQPAFFDHCRKVFARHAFALTALREATDHHVLLADVASGAGIALLPDSFRSLRRSGVVYRKLAEGDELSVGVGLALPADREELRSFLLAACVPSPAPPAGGPKAFSSR